MTHRLVEVLTFAGCPHAEPALALVHRVVAETGADATVRRIDIADEQAAAARRFLGSPTVRVDGHDIEPGAGERAPASASLLCRLYRTDRGLRAEPDERWLRDALRRA